MYNVAKTTRWLKRLFKRRLGYQVSALIIISLGLCLVFLVILPTALGLWRELGARTPWGSSQLIPVRVSLSQLSEREREQIKREPRAVPMHQTQPGLKLVGLGSEVNEAGDELVLGLLPSDAARVLKADTLMSVRVEAPSLSLLMDDLMSSPRGRALRDSAQARQAKLLSSWSELLPSLQESLGKHLKPEELTRIMSDELILARLKGALQRQIVERLKVEELTAELGESEALSNLGELAFKHVSKWDVFKEFSGGAWGGLKEGGGEVTGQLKELWNQDMLTLDSALCAAHLASSTGYIPFFLESFTRGSSKLCETLKSSAKGVFVKGAKRGGVSLLSQSFESLRVESDQAAEEGKQLFQEAVRLSEAPLLLQSFWGQLSHDEQLISHIKSQYGEDVLQRFSLAVRELSTSESFHRKVERLQLELTSLGREAFKAIALDREGRGPNPLLLAVIQEQLSGQLRPVVHVVPGSGAAVKAHYLFPSQAEVSR